MNRRLASVLLLAPLAPLVAQDPDPEMVEPPEQFELTLGGRTYEVRAGEPFEVELAGETYAGDLEPSDTRRLALDDLSFEYPNGMTFEYEASPGMRMWTLDGNDAVIMVQRFAFGVKQENLVVGIEESLAELGDPVRDDASIELEGTTHRGVTIDVEISDFTLHSEVYMIGEKVALILQDSRDVGEDVTEEFELARELLEDTFTRE